MLPNIGPKNKVSIPMSLSTCIPMHVFFKDTTCFRYPFSRNASNRLCVNKCTAQYDVRSPHTTRPPRYARFLCGPTFKMSVSLFMHIRAFEKMYVLFSFETIRLNQSEQIVRQVWHLSHSMAKPTKWHMRPAKTQISMGIRPVWSESSLSVWRSIGSLPPENLCSLKINVPTHPVENGPTYPDHISWWKTCCSNRGSDLINIIHNRTESRDI